MMMVSIWTIYLRKFYFKSDLFSHQANRWNIFMNLQKVMLYELRLMNRIFSLIVFLLFLLF